MSKQITLKVTRKTTVKRPTDPESIKYLGKVHCVTEYSIAKYPCVQASFLTQGQRVSPAQLKKIDAHMRKTIPRDIKRWAEKLLTFNYRVKIG